MVSEREEERRREEGTRDREDGLRADRVDDDRGRDDRERDARGRDGRGRDDGGRSDRRRRLVRYRVVFLERGLEHAFAAREAVIDGCDSRQEVEDAALIEFVRHLDREERPALWIERSYPPGVRGRYIERLPEGASRWLRVDVESLACYETEGRDRDRGRIDALEEIAEALGGGRRPRPSRVRLPKSRRLAGPLDDRESEFGDEFFGLPASFGQRPRPGETRLTGWIEIEFQKVTEEYADFTFRYAGAGTPVAIRWGGGQIFEFDRTRTFPLPGLPCFGQGCETPFVPLENRARLDLATGEVSLVHINAVFQGTTIGRTDRTNRINYAFPYMFPMTPPPPEGVPVPDLPMFGKIDFRLDPDGSIVGVDLSSETLALVFLFPRTPFFPPFSFGPDFKFFFANPDRSLPATPAGNTFSAKLAPDGSPMDPAVFHPHINLVSHALREVDGPPLVAPCLPRAAARGVTAVAGGRLYVIGGLEEGETVSARVQVYDPATNRWQEGPPLPQAVWGAQGAAVGRRIYVAGGWTDRKRTLTGRVQVLDLDSGRWSAGPELPVPVAEATATAVGGKLFVVGGWSGGTAITPAVQVLDTGGGGWSRGADSSLPTVGAAAIEIDGRIWVINGRYDQRGITSRTVIYDPASDQWGLGPDTCVGVVAAVAGRIGQRLLLVGGRQEVAGPALKVVQELYLDRDEAAWRYGLQQPVETAASFGAALGEHLFVVGGRVQTLFDEPPGRLTDLAQTFSPISDWTLCGSRPVFTSAGVVSSAALVPGPRQLAAGSRAAILGDRLSTGREGPEDVTVRVGGKEAQVLWVRPQRIELVLPDDLPAGKTELELEVSWSTVQAPPVEVEIAAAAPGLFGYTYGEVGEPAFLADLGGLACNGDGTLNYAGQPAAPGEKITLYATGLPADAVPGKVKVRMGVASMRNAPVSAVAAAPGLPGVVAVTVTVPEKTEPTNNVPVELRYGGATSNRVVVSVRETALRPPEPTPCELGFVFVFSENILSPLPFHPQVELAEDRQPEAAYWRNVTISQAPGS